MQKYSLIMVLLYANFIHAQGRQNIQELKVGDYLPEVSLNYVHNGVKGNYSNKDFKGKLVILDFWNIHCPACIAAMPRLDSLQRIFGSKLKVILVTRDSESDVDKLFARITIPRPDLDMINNDKILHSLFSVRIFPGQVWIGANGRVAEIPATYNANEETLMAYLSGKPVKLIQKGKSDYYSDIPLLPQLIKDSSISIGYSSVLVRGLEERGNSTVSIRLDSTTHQPVLIRAIDQSIFSLYRIAFERDIFGYDYGNFADRNNTRVIVNVKNPGFQHEPEDLSKIDDWKRSSLYSYELKLPAERSSHAYDQMKSDLATNFGYDARIEKKPVKCLILERIDGALLPKISDNAEIPFSGYAKGGFVLTNKPLLGLIKELAYVFSVQKEPLPVVDVTGVSYNVDMKLTGDLSDRNNLNGQLKASGLQLVEAERSINMLILSDPK